MPLLALCDYVYPNGEVCGLPSRRFGGDAVHGSLMVAKNPATQVLIQRHMFHSVSGDLLAENRELRDLLARIYPVVRQRMKKGHGAGWVGWLIHAQALDCTPDKLVCVVCGRRGTTVVSRGTSECRFCKAEWAKTPLVPIEMEGA